ncbi:MAG: hypothetical protein LBH45_01855 [Campylobacteraceae bacterium]|nr:hypothetical protein [Campylobacteraceae bacterium]
MKRLISIAVLAFVAIGFTACESEADKLAKMQMEEEMVDMDIKKWEEKLDSKKYNLPTTDKGLKEWGEETAKYQACINEMTEQRRTASQSKACQGLK